MPRKKAPVHSIKARLLLLPVLLVALLSCLALPKQYVKWATPTVSAEAKLARAKTSSEGPPDIASLGAFFAQETLTPCSNSITVSTTDDSGIGSLRDAMSSVCAGGTITFDPALTSSGPATITLLTALPDIASNMTIMGPGANLLTVQRSAANGTPNFRIFTIQYGFTVAISAMTIANGNPGSGQVGGGIANAGTLTLTNCNVSGNTSGDDGGGIYHSGGATLTLNNTTVSGNTAIGARGGGIFNSGSTEILNNSNIGGASAGQPNTAADGGGIYDLSGTVIMTGGSVVGNSGGGIAKVFGGTLTLNGVAVTNNVSGNNGLTGGVENSLGTATIINSLIANNSATATAGGFFNGGTATLVNTTISGNSSAVNGGGIVNQGGFINGSPTISLTNVTVTNNRSDSDNSGGEQGGGIYRQAGTVTLKNTIVAGNFRGTDTTRDDVSGAIDAASSFNLVGDGTNMTGLSNGGSGNQVGNSTTPINAVLGVLANNGGATQTHLLLPGSPAIDAGNNALLPADTFDLNNNGNTTEALPVDQRGVGFNRVIGTTTDIGAVETNYAISASAGNNQVATINTKFPTQLQATVTESGNALSGITVTFTAPSNGASGTFQGTGTNNATVTTDSNGVATAPVFTANATSGSYNVTANLGNGLPTATFGLKNNTPPVAINQQVTTNEDTAKVITLTGSDADGDTLTFTVTNNPAHGTFSGTAPNLTYTPAANYNGPDSFTFKVNDGQVDSNTATVSITVNAPPANIMLSNSSVADNSPAGKTVGTFSTTDADSSNFTYTLVSGDGSVDNSSFTIAGNVLKTAALFDFETKSAFYIRVRSADEGGLYFEKQFIITVTDGPDNPGTLSFSSSSYSVGEGDGSATITVKRTGGTDNPVIAKVVPGAAGDTASTADYSFSPGGLDTTLATTGTGLENVPQAIVVQTDGKLVIGGFFTIYNGTTRKYIARLNADGSLDATFAPTGTGLNSYVRTIALQPDGKVIVGGDFTDYNGIQRGHLARLNTDGTLDTNFLQGGSGFNGLVRAMAVQPDGKIIVVGEYTSFNGTNRSRVARLNSDGSLDTSFLQSGSGTDGTVTAVALQPDGKIVIGGLFFEYSSIPRRFIARLNTDGTLDNTFTQTGTGLNGIVLSIAVQRDGKLAIAGGFTSYNGTSRAFLARLNSGGSLDGSFGQTGTGLDGVVVTLALQPDEKVIVSGFFTSYNGTSRKYVARFNADGTLDATFNQTGTGLNDYVPAMALQPDGKIAVSGPFNSYNGTGRLFIARLYGDIFVTFPAGDATNKTIQFPVIDDSIPESNETVTFSLIPVAGGATTTAPSSATLTILDNDFSSTSAVSGSGVFGGTATLSATLTRAGGSGLSGKTIAFTLNNTAVGTAVTNSSGVATLSGVSLSGIGAGTQANAVRASFAGDANFSGSSNTGPLTVSKAAATVTLGNLTQPYDGTAKTVSATTNPPGLNVTLTYNGSVTPPTNMGNYTVVGTINDANYQGSTTATLKIVCPTVVTNSNDSGPGSLRNVIASACDGSTITFDMTQVVSPIILTSGELAVNKNLTISGPGVNQLTIRRSTANGTPNFRIFRITSSLTAISGITISNGRSPDGVPAPIFGGPGEAGGGILNDGGVLNLTDLIVTGNHTGNGALPSRPSDVGTSYGGSGGPGGGIFSRGTLTMTNVTVSNNSTGDGASSYYGGSGGLGGGIYIASGILTMTGCSVTGNLTAKGAVGTSSGASSGSGGYGGGLYINSGTVKITDSGFSNNTTGGTEVAGPNNSGSGGGGGGIYAGTGNVSIINSTISGNHTGDGIGFAGQGGFGGGILSSATLTIIGSTINGNSTGTNGSNGGGVGGGVVNDGTLSMINSTISGNATTGVGGTGAGLWNAGTATLTNCTVAFNSAAATTFGGAGIHIFNDFYSVNLGNTIVARNTLSGATNSTDLGGTTFISRGHNFIGNADGSSGLNASGDQVGTSAAPLDPLLGPLQNNGGTTQTHLLLPGSPAINAGSNALLPQDTFDMNGNGNTSETLPFDQRGTVFPRIVNTTVDIGAVEVNYSISATAGTPQSATIKNSFGAQFQASVVESAINKSGIPVTFTAPSGGAGGTFAGGLTSVTVTTNSGGIATAPAFTANGTAGSYNVTASLGTGLPSATYSLTNKKGDQTINFATIPDRSYSAAPFALIATATSGLPVSFSVSSGPATINGNTLTIIGTGTITVRAAQPGDDNYNLASPVDQSFTVSKANQNINFGALPNKTFGDKDFTVSAEASSGLSVSFSATGDCAVSGQTVHITGAGSCAVTASQAGDGNYNAAMSVSRSFTIAKATPVITWANPANILAGIALSGTQLNATADMPGTFTYTPPAGTVFNTIGTYTLSVIFTPTDIANYNSPTKSVQVTVVPLPPPAFTFGSSSYSVSEADGNVAVIVNRTGDSAPAVSVNYATSDTAELTACNQAGTGIASSRCDYATTVGTLQFGAGETTKTIFIPVVNDSYAEGNESFTIRLSNPSGATLGAVSTATITVADDDVTTGGNPIVGPSFFIRQQYIDFLGREPDPAGLAGWLDVLNNCGTKYPQPCDRIEVSAGFFRSPEFQDRGYFVFRFYPAALGRNPNYSEFMPDLAKVSGFLTDAELEANKVAFVNEFISRAEFQARYGSIDDAGFVDALLKTAGLPDHPTRTTWINALASQTMTRAQVLRALVESTEAYQKYYNTAFVVMQYFGYLRRDPDILYLDWIKIMDANGGDYRTMINGFMNSSEYFLRFGP